MKNIEVIRRENVVHKFLGRALKELENFFFITGKFKREDFQRNGKFIYKQRTELVTII